MKRKQKLRMAAACLIAASVLALGSNAQAMTIQSGLGATGSGTLTDPFVVTVSPASGLFLDTINFDLGTDTHFNMSSSVNNIQFFGASIFENVGDTEVVAASSTHSSVLLPDLGQSPFDYHLHPQGLNAGGGTYTLNLWGSTPAPVPLPAAAWLFGSGVIGLVGLARRKMAASA
jgi:hypothetical protein